MITGLLFACSLFLGMSPNNAQVSKPSTKFNFIADYDRFRYSDSLTSLEVTATLYRDILNYVPADDKYRAEFDVTAEIIGSDSVIARKQWKNINTVDSLGEVSNSQLLYCMTRFVIPQGDYKLRIAIADPNSANRAVGEFPVHVPIFKKDSLRISDLQISTSIERDTANDVYVKNGYRIRPNPSSLYGIGLPMLYSYAEIYNLAKPTKEQGTRYLVNYKILNSDGKIVKSLPPKTCAKPVEMPANANSIDLVEVSKATVVVLVSGAYSLLMEVEDQENGQKAAIQKKFFVYREGDYAEGGARFAKQEEVQTSGSPGLDADRYDVMGEKELDQEFDYARYIAEKEERNTYKKLPLEGKRKYLKEFWARRDNTPATPENEVKQDYLGRISLANTNFKGIYREGWRTDRGRVFLIYGKPDEIERHPFSSEERAYETWHYYSVQGGVYFYFVDKREMGDYELVHSTARNELYDAEWTRWLNPNN